VLDNYAWCCYGLDNLHFVHKEHNYPKAIIKEKYFKDFEFYTKNEEKNIEYDDQLVVIFINPQIFVKRLATYFNNHNYLKYHLHPVTYIKRTDEKINLKCEYPFELFYKDKYFMNQNEIRCVLENDKSDFYNDLIKNNGIIEIGNLSDCISNISDYYFKELSIILVGENKAIFELPHEVAKNYDEMSFDELFENIIDDFTRDKYKIDFEKLNFYNMYLVKYGIEMVYDETTLVVRGMTDDHHIVINQILDKYIGVVNFWNEMNNYYDLGEVDKFKDMLKEHENDNIYINNILYFKALIEFDEGKYEEALQHIIKCKEKIVYNESVELLHIRILSMYNDKDILIYYCNKYIEKFGTNIVIDDILKKIV